MLSSRKLAVAVIIILLILGVGIYSIRYYKYPQETKKSLYGGLAQMVVQTSEQVVAIPYDKFPSNEYPPIMTTSDRAQVIDREKYEVTLVPPQQELKFAVGRFAGWEEIEDSSDKYLILKHNGGEIARYRVGVEESELFGLELTGLAVEKVMLTTPGIMNIVVPAEKEKMEKMIKRGDTVVVLPVWDIPELSKRDENGEYLVSRVIVRRLGIPRGGWL